MNRSLRAAGLVAGILVLAATPGFSQASVSTDANAGSVGHAVLGGLAGGYGGLVLGSVTARLVCARPRRCPLVLLVLGLAGVTAGSVAGVVDRERAYGGFIGAGVGVLGGALAWTVWSGVAHLTHGREPDPFTGLGMALVGGAVGAVLGTVVSRSGERAVGNSAPVPLTTVKVSF